MLSLPHNRRVEPILELPAPEFGASRVFPEAGSAELDVAGPGVVRPEQWIRAMWLGALPLSDCSISGLNLAMLGPEVVGLLREFIAGARGAAAADASSLRETEAVHALCNLFRDLGAREDSVVTPASLLEACERERERLAHDLNRLPHSVLRDQPSIRSTFYALGGLAKALVLLSPSEPAATAIGGAAGVVHS